MSLSCIDKKLLGSFNVFLSNCELPFILICVALEKKWLSDLEKFASNQKECHLVGGEPEVPYALVAIDQKSKMIASYISFSESSKGSGKWCEEHDPLRALALKFSCTGSSYRKLGLSKLLRLVIIAYAIHQGYEEVVSSVNEVSGHILSKYFGFELRDGTELMRENCAFNFELDINTRLVLHKDNLDEYYRTYKAMKNCKLYNLFSPVKRLEELAYKKLPKNIKDEIKDSPVVFNIRRKILPDRKKRLRILNEIKDHINLFRDNKPEVHFLGNPNDLYNFSMLDKRTILKFFETSPNDLLELIQEEEGFTDAEMVDLNKPIDVMSDEDVEYLFDKFMEIYEFDEVYDVYVNSMLNIVKNDKNFKIGDWVYIDSSYESRPEYGWSRVSYDLNKKVLIYNEGNDPYTLFPEWIKEKLIHSGFLRSALPYDPIDEEW